MVGLNAPGKSIGLTQGRVQLIVEIGYSQRFHLSEILTTGRQENPKFRLTLTRGLDSGCLSSPKLSNSLDPQVYEADAASCLLRYSR